jgi:hypothetical protein
LGLSKASLGHVLPGGGKQATAKLLSSAGARFTKKNWQI